LAAAIAARQQGLRVIVADGAQGPIDKACGEGLMPRGLAALKKLGICLPEADSYAFRGIRFLSDGRSVDASFPDGASATGVRRTVLHRLMMNRADSLGIDFLWQTPVTGISADAVHLGSRKLRTRWVIGADGGSSRVRRWAGLNNFRRRDCRYAFRQHFRVAPWTDRMELHWGGQGEIYVTPVSKDEVCVASVSRDPRLRLTEALQRYPELQARLDGAAASSAERGAITATSRLNRVTREHIALIGDASGTVDAITGEGLCLAFSQALVLADCLATGDLARYPHEHRKLARRPQLTSQLLLTLNGRPSLQRRALQAFQKRPDIFRRLLAFHVGALSPLNLTMDGLALGWGLLTA
jgi:flavin-dependent dehydrogenase